MAISNKIIAFLTHKKKYKNHKQYKKHKDYKHHKILQRIKSSSELLATHQNLIAKIYHHSHAPKPHFNNLYLYSIKRLACWTQGLPASQNHHHSNVGGLLLHTLEVIEIALKQRNTKMLPIGESVEL